MHLIKHGFLQLFYFLIAPTAISARNRALVRRVRAIQRHYHSGGVEYIINVCLVHQSFMSAVHLLVGSTAVRVIVYDQILLVLQIGFLSIGHGLDGKTNLLLAGGILVGQLRWPFPIHLG